MQRTAPTAGAAATLLRRSGVALTLWLCACAVSSAPHPAPSTPARQNVREEGPTTFRLATFNIQVFGKAKASRPEVLDQLARIIRTYDLVAVQEFKDKSQQVPHLFLEEINRLGPAYGLELSPRTGLQPDDRRSQEQYGYYYRTDRLEVIGVSTLFDDSGHDYFQREPYLTHFRLKENGHSFVLINIHTRPEAAVEEIAALAAVFDWARARYPDEDDFVAVGDFNAGCGYASEDDLDALPIHGDAYDWIVPHSADTNLADTRCPYDRIVVASPAANAYVQDWGVDRAFDDRKISDHWPVWAVFVADHP